MLLAQLTPQQADDVWKAFINFGVVGIIAVLALGFVGIVIWSFWMLLKGIAKKYLPTLLDELILTFQSVRNSQEGIATNQQSIAEGQKLSAENFAKLLELVMAGAARDSELAAILKTKMDPFGTGYKDHVFSSTRIEEFLLISLDILEKWLDRDDNVTLKADWKDHIQAMRISLRNRKTAS